jgi:Predicted methyltransferase (contains TPR repeat)
MSSLNTGNNGADQAITESTAIIETRGGSTYYANLRRLSRFSVVVDVHGAEPVLRASEALENLKIVSDDRTIYSGPSVVRNMVAYAASITCELMLEESGWFDLKVDRNFFEPHSLRQQFQDFVKQWQKLYKILPEFKIAVADLQSFLLDLRHWLDQVELNIRSQPAGCDESERKALKGLAEPVLQNLGVVFERFEYVTQQLDPNLRSAHSLYAQRQLHPLVLCAPFMYRTFRKPLGYAGDYEMVNMMARDPFQGASVFAKVLNTFFLNTPPVVAHRNRIDYLYSVLVREIDRVSRSGGVARVLNLGCGPALEIQAFLEKSPPNLKADFTLLDFNDETVAHTTGVLNSLKNKFGRSSEIRILKKSVAQFLKEQSKPVSSLGGKPFDLVYCAGLFDYLADPICERLLSAFYNLTAPGGVVVSTNVDLANPSRGWMEYMVDWYLCYRDSKGMGKLMPQVPAENLRVFSDESGVNVMMEARRTQHG